MQAYQTGLKGSGTRLVVTPDSEFFRFFNDPAGAGPAAPATTPPSTTSSPASPAAATSSPANPAAAQAEPATPTVQ
jgi:membrane protease subunit HflC